MKKTLITLTLILGMTIGATAQMSGGGLFQRGYDTGNSRGDEFSPMLPSHGLTDDQDGTDAPLTGGVALMFSLGVLYLTRQKRNED